MREKIQRILKRINKPSRYTGKEIGSFNKDWDSAEVRAALAFPDLYEIGISNLGLRILYDKINRYEQKNFLADRVYAPEVDFKKELAENHIPLYGVESFKPLNDFDMIAFSLQYELSYPTILSMFEMANIPIKSVDRNESHPIIAAGGPGSYNPEPISEFIDVFLIGDGETIIIELLETISDAKSQNLTREETLKNLAKLQGVYVPRFYKSEGYSKPTPICHCEQSEAIHESMNSEWIASSQAPRNDEEAQNDNYSLFPSTITKRIDDIDNMDYPVEFPIPYSTAVHDRAVIELRRGCGRMCRFCQACFVNLPVRERSPGHVVEIADNILKNTGYDEYSLLALSSNDYKNIEKLVSILNEKHSCSGVSISLPSQRADKFSLELAELVNSVRKSTITIAPEAGSQRLRDVINKNLTEEQILDAVLSVYKTGWDKIKLYFMIGLPTETYEDLDGIISLLQTIKMHAGKLKNELGLRKFLSITCTISIFVPKPFTPFQWAAQDKLEVIEDKIRYLRQKARPLRDVKLNFHDSFLCLLEAVFSRGGRDLNRLVEEVYKNGSYLDAWNEHFNKDIWLKTAESLSINLEEMSSKEFDVNDELPWDIFNVGVNKSWLINEYKTALECKTSKPCDEGCAGCGVCKNLQVSPSLKGNKLDDSSTDCHCEADCEQRMEGRLDRPETPFKASNQAEGQSPDVAIQKEMTSNWIASSQAPRNVGSKMKIHAENSDNAYRYRMKLQKINELKYISHLDWQKLIYGAIRKAGLKINFTQGFNPGPKFSLAVALPLFTEGIAECADIEMQENISPEEIKERLNAFLPESSKIQEIVNISKDKISIEKAVYWAKYIALPVDFEKIEKINLKSIVKNALLQDNIIIEKFSKKKCLKKVDIRSAIHSLIINESNGQYKLDFILKAGQDREPIRMISLDSLPDCKIEVSNSTLRADQFLNFLTPEIEWDIVREKLLDFEFKELV